jgi:hypothetical protein
MLFGFSLSPGGLLLPYHVGVLASLAHHGILTDQTPLAGSSAGAIAVAGHAAGVSSEKTLEASVRVSSKCNPLFLAQGQLLPSLRHELNSILTESSHEIINQREGQVGLAHYEIYPSIQPKLQTEFDSKESLIDAICDSSTFPYFTTNQPWGVHRCPDNKWKVNRVVLDGIFTEPGERFGCPNIESKVDREIKIMVMPKELPLVFNGEVFKPNSQARNNIISPDLEAFNPIAQATKLSMMATSTVPRKWLTDLYESGFEDAERWVRTEEATNRLVS